MKKQKKSNFPKLMMLIVLGAFIVTVAASYGHTHHDGHEKNNCEHHLFLQQYTAIESTEIKLFLPEGLLTPAASRDGTSAVSFFLHYNPAYPNAPPA